MDTTEEGSVDLLAKVEHIRQSISLYPASAFTGTWICTIGLVGGRSRAEAKTAEGALRKAVTRYIEDCEEGT